MFGNTPISDGPVSAVKGLNPSGPKPALRARAISGALSTSVPSRSKMMACGKVTGMSATRLDERGDARQFPSLEPFEEGAARRRDVGELIRHASGIEGCNRIAAARH